MARRGIAVCLLPAEFLTAVVFLTVVFLATPIAAFAQCDSVDYQQLLGSDADSYDNAGFDVAVDGAVAVLGLPNDDDRGQSAGAACVFRCNGSSWVPEQKLTAGDGAPGDYFGYAVAISGGVIAIGAKLEDGSLRDAGAVYVFRFDGIQWVEQQKLTAGDPNFDDHFGHSVAVAGSFIAIGAHLDDDRGLDSGSVYMFHYNGLSWDELQKLTASDGNSLEYFGGSVSLDGKRVLVGAHRHTHSGTADGAAYVFCYASSVWTEEQELLASDPAHDDSFGRSVSIQGSLAAVGSFLDDDGGDASGSAYVFRHDGIVWSEEQKLTAGDASTNDSFGVDVCLSGDGILVGAYGDNDGLSLSGSAYVFRHDGRTWYEERKLTAASTGLYDFFGYSVAASGDVGLVGNPYDDDNGQDSGSACVFNISELCAPSAEQKVLAPDGDAGDSFGGHVAVRGDVGVIIAPRDGPHGADSGSAYVYRRIADAWTFEQKLTASDGATGDQFGSGGVAVCGDVIAVGASETNSQAGSVYVYRFDGSNWSEEQILSASDAAPGDLFGQGLDFDCDRIAVGGAGNDDQGNSSGSVYVFSYDGARWLEDQKLVAADGTDLDHFGLHLALDGDLLIASSEDDDLGLDAGAAYIFQHDGSQWLESQKLTDPVPYAGAMFGNGLSLSGELALIASPRNPEAGTDAGLAYIFGFDGVAWVLEQELRPPDGAAGDGFGDNVSLDGNLAVVGAPRDSHQALGQSGSANVFRHDGTRWRYQEKLVPEPGVRAFHLCSVSDQTVVVGATGVDDLGIDAGGAYFFDVPAIGLDVDPETDVDIGEVIEFRACPGRPGSFHVLAVTDLGGTPTFIRVVVGMFDARGEYRLAVPVPPGLSSLAVGLRVFGVSQADKITGSNVEQVTFK